MNEFELMATLAMLKAADKLSALTREHLDNELNKSYQCLLHRADALAELSRTQRRYEELAKRVSEFNEVEA